MNTGYQINRRVFKTVDIDKKNEDFADIDKKWLQLRKRCAAATYNWILKDKMCLELFLNVLMSLSDMDNKERCL